MKLTRRQTLLGLVGTSSGLSLSAYELTDDTSVPEPTLSQREFDGLLAVADVVHPSDPQQFESLIAGYVDRLSDDRKRLLRRTLSDLDRASYRQSGVPFRSLSPAERRRLFAALGVARVQSRPRGTVPERVRYHLVNSIVFVLVTNPKGTGLFGIRNPVGHPGGFYEDQ